MASLSVFEPDATGITYNGTVRVVADKQGSRADFSTQHFYPEYIEGLPTYVFRTHIDHAFQSKARAYGGRSNAMLSCTSLSNYTFLTETLCEKNLRLC